MYILILSEYRTFTFLTGGYNCYLLFIIILFHVLIISTFIVCLFEDLHFSAIDLFGLCCFLLLLLEGSSEFRHYLLFLGK
jgi:hypothetical protein